MLPTIKIKENEFTRLIIGGDPFSGNSHKSSKLDEKMKNFYTTEKIKETLFRAEECGINTMQLRGDSFMFRMIREFKNDGGKLKWIAETASEYKSHVGNVNQIVENGADAIYHHPTMTDSLFKEKKIEELKYRLEVIRDTEKPVGLGTHIPEVIEYVEEYDWDIDFYVASVYNISKIERVSVSVLGETNEGEPFHDEDRKRMYKTIQATDKPCLAFKILGDGRKCDTVEDIKNAFQEAFKNIKEKDAIIVGVFPRNKDQIKENVEIVKSIYNHSDID